MPDPDPVHRPDRSGATEPPAGEVAPHGGHVPAPHGGHVPAPHGGHVPVPPHAPPAGLPVPAGGSPPQWVLPPPTGFRAWWARPRTVAGMFALVLVLLVALVLVTIRLASRDGEGTAAPASSPSPTASPTPRPTEGIGLPTPTNPAVPTTAPATVPPATPGRGPLPPAPIGPGETYQTGTYDLDQGDTLDLDRNLAGFSGEDLSVFPEGISGNDGSVFARWPGAGRPLLSDCAAKPEPEWGPFIAGPELVVGAKYCVVSSNDRYGYFMVQRIASRDGTLRTVTVTFQLWKKSTDE